jgi:hypothetical protein
MTHNTSPHISKTPSSTGILRRIQKIRIRMPVLYTGTDTLVAPPKTEPQHFDRARAKICNVIKKCYKNTV